MKVRARFAIVALIAAGLPFMGCKQRQRGERSTTSCHGRENRGNGADPLTLSEHAVRGSAWRPRRFARRRLALDGRRCGRSCRTALIYDKRGRTWTYTSPSLSCSCGRQSSSNTSTETG